MNSQGDFLFFLSFFFPTQSSHRDECPYCLIELVVDFVSSSSFQCSPGKFPALHGVLISSYFWVQDSTRSLLWPLQCKLLSFCPHPCGLSEPQHMLTTQFPVSFWPLDLSCSLSELNQDCKMMFIIFYPTFLGILC